MPRRIEDCALPRDCATAALVARDGSVDWLCWPRFDPGACFAALLAGPEHGRWQLAPRSEGVRVNRRHRVGTLVLETPFETADVAVTIVDFMPVERSPQSNLVRFIIGRRGVMPMRCDLVLRFDYGPVVPAFSHLGLVGTAPNLFRGPKPVEPRPDAARRQA